MGKSMIGLMVGLGLLGSAAGADKPAAAPPPLKPAPQMEQLRVFLGKWKCAGKQHATPMYGPAHSFTGGAEGKLEADGFWQLFSYEEKKSKEHPGLKVIGLWGWEAAGSRFVRAAGTTQSLWDAGTSAGWNRDQMVWTGELAGPEGRTPFRQTFARKSDREWSFRFELNPLGTWLPLTEVTCKK
jgi:hypothetical protein